MFFRTDEQSKNDEQSDQNDKLICFISNNDEQNLDEFVDKFNDDKFDDFDTNLIDQHLDKQIDLNEFLIDGTEGRFFFD